MPLDSATGSLSVPFLRKFSLTCSLSASRPVPIRFYVQLAAGGELPQCLSKHATLSLRTGILLGPEELLSWSARVFSHILILEDISPSG